jgi:cytochrome P450
VCADAGGEPARRGGAGRRAQLTIDELEADPHAALARLRAAEPVAWVDALGAWLVTSRELALQAMRDAETFTVDDPRFSTAQVVGQSMLTRDGAEHARHRDPFARPFRLAAVRTGFGAVVVAETDRLIDAFADGRAELRRELAGPLAVAVVAHALGLERTDKVLGWYDAIVASVSGVAAGRPVTAAGAAAFAELAASLGPVLDDAPGLTRDEIVSNAAVIMFGGIETTEGMIANAIWHLLSHPDQLALVEADRSLLRNAVEESLRLEPAAAVIDRYATRDTVLGRATIGGGEQVTLSLAAANRDPAVFPAPDRFDVRRQNAKLHLAFAQGPHVCIGMHLARLEAFAAVGRLLDRLPGLRLDGETAPRGLVFRKPPELRVTWDQVSP